MSEFRVINTENIPFILNNYAMVSGNHFKKESFDYVGSWRIKIRPEGQGVAHRTALIRDVEDTQGNKYLLIVHFAIPIVKKGTGIPVEFLQDLYSRVMDLVDETSVLASERLGNVGGVYTSAPAFMQSELEQIIDNQKV